MHANSLAGVPEIFQKLTDPRDPRGVRFPYHALCGLVFLGLLARITEMTVFAALTNAAISALRMLPNPEPILRAETEKFQWNPTKPSKRSDFK